MPEAPTTLFGVWFARVDAAEYRIDLAMPPLDRYSFPSGHSLHAVSFALQASMHFPQLAWVLIPLALTIAASRVVLGLHYPTDVLAGAIPGASLGALGLALS